jgi:hypothetical protein
MNKFVQGAMAAAIILGGGIAGSQGAFAQGDGLNREMYLVNRSDSSIIGFYASNIGTNSWEENILSGEELDPGYRVRMNLDDGTGYCRFDFKTVFQDGSYVIRRNVDVCQLVDYTITN